MIKVNNKVEQFLFARWIVIDYSSEILNKEDGEWWKERLEYFTKEVLPSYKQNGNYKNTVEFLKIK